MIKVSDLHNLNDQNEIKKRLKRLNSLIFFESNKVRITSDSYSIQIQQKKIINPTMLTP